MNSYAGKRKRSNSTYNQKKKFKKTRKTYGGLPVKREQQMGKAVYQNQLVVADKQMVQLQYTDIDTPNLQVQLGAAVSQVNTYILNGLFDVNAAIASSAMPGFTEWGAFYRYYKVRSVRIKMDILSQTAGANIGWLMHAQPAGVAPPVFTSWAAIREFEGNAWTKRGTLCAIGSGQTKEYCDFFLDLGKLQGDRLNYESSDLYRGILPTTVGAGSNPSAAIVLYLVAYKLDGAAAGAIFNAAITDLRIKFYSELFGRVDLVT